MGSARLRFSESSHVTSPGNTRTPLTFYAWAGLELIFFLPYRVF
jgi:hypothetical protein